MLYKKEKYIMTLNSKRWFILVYILFFYISFPILHEPKSSLWALENEPLSDKNPFIQVEISKEVTSKPFRLVEARILDDQMLDNLSPALVAPAPVIISQKERKQIIKQNYENSVCFKRCHSRNDFSAGAYSVKQWRLLIEKDGHAIFCKIPWSSSQEKEKVIKYLSKTASNHRPDTEGIGNWEQ
jgi:hypothetical protein